MTKIARIINSADIPDPAHIPDPYGLEYRWQLWGVPAHVIYRHVEHLKHLQEEHNRPVQKVEEPKASLGPTRDLTGQRFGSITVLRLHDKAKGNHFRWLVKCDCGRVTPMYQTNLLRRNPTCEDCARKLRGRKRRKVPFEEVETLLKKGVKQQEIADRYQVTQAAISYVALKLGLGKASQRRTQ